MRRPLCKWHQHRKGFVVGLFWHIPEDCSEEPLTLLLPRRSSPCLHLRGWYDPPRLSRWYRRSSGGPRVSTLDEHISTPQPAAIAMKQGSIRSLLTLARSNVLIIVVLVCFALTPLL